MHCHFSKTNLLHKRHISEINPSNIIGNLIIKGIDETHDEREFLGLYSMCGVYNLYV